jgi:hypothetical protein
MPENYYVKSRTHVERRRGGNRKENDMRVRVKRDHSIFGLMAGGTSSGTLAHLSVSFMLWNSKAQHGLYSLSVYSPRLSEAEVSSMLVANQVISAVFGLHTSSFIDKYSTPRSATGRGGKPGHSKDEG